jgi:3',5'-cyclic AMP phosphodiesterase CpdA
MKRLLLPVLLLSSLLAASAAKTTRIALLSDTHTNLRTNGNEAQFNVRFDKAIAAVNAAKVDFVLITGDLTNSGKEEEMAEFKKHVKKFKPPVYFVPGNHDVGHKFNSGKKDGTVTRDRVELFEKNLGPSFFTKTKAGVRVIGINTSLLGSGYDRETEQWAFLEKELAKPAKTPPILFMHYPPYVKTVGEAGGVYWNIEPEPRQRLLALAKQGGCELLLSGHLHHTLENRADGILLFSAPPISFGLPKNKQPEGWVLVTIAPEKTTLEFQEVEAHAAK